MVLMLQQTLGIQIVPVWWRKAAYHTASLVGLFGLVYMLYTGVNCPAPWLDCHVPRKVYDSRQQQSGASDLAGDRGWWHVFT